MSRSVDRREFLKKALIAGTAVPAFSSALTPPSLAAANKSKSPNEKLNLATIGVADRAYANITGTKSENFVALCDIDAQRLEKASKEFPHADTYDDYRKALDRDDLDGVLVSTPDHMHAAPAVTAIRAAKHVYLQKPMATTLHECRVITQEAAKAGVIPELVDMDDPHEHPELLDPTLRFDELHLHEKGAIAYTEALAREIAGLLEATP